MKLQKIADKIDEIAYQHFKHAMGLNESNNEYYSALNRVKLLRFIAITLKSGKHYSYYKRFDSEK